MEPSALPTPPASANAPQSVLPTPSASTNAPQDVPPPAHSRHVMRTIARATALILFVALVVFGLYVVRKGTLSLFAPAKVYQEVYALVADSISQHGAIVVHLPAGVPKQGIEQHIAFEPHIEGRWEESELSDVVVYRPTDELMLGSHYEVALTIANGVIRKDFKVDEDPRIVEVFPNSEAEAELNSAITIVFNRPMVPLTTLSEIEGAEVPVTISPETPGKWKWISTRTLQFIPTKGLWGSAHYSVKISNDFTSTDGLVVLGDTYEFTTKALRLLNSTTGEMAYDQPMKFYFNQPVDISKTLPYMTLRSSSGANISAVADYGKKKVWDSSRGEYVEQVDRSVIAILPKNSTNGHENVWDFSSSYQADISTVYPVGGDILLTDAQAPSATMTTSPALKEVRVESDRTPLSSADLFDPAGTTTFSFYEDIDIRRSTIRAKGLKSITYGRMCEHEEGQEYSSVCKQVDDTSSLIMKFDPNAFTKGERVEVVFERLVNADGYQINNLPITSPLAVYPELRVLKTTPQTGDVAASIKEIIVCTNVPLKRQEAKDFYENFHADKYMVFGRWSQSYLSSPHGYEKNPPCDPGQYVQRISYGLLPQKPYRVEAAVEDVFDQKQRFSFSVQTEAAPDFYLRFQSLHNAYNVTTPDKTRLTFMTENFDYVDMTACKLAPASMLALLARGANTVTTDPDGALPCIDSVRKVIPLTSDQWVNQYFQVDVKELFADPRGQYVLSFTHPGYTVDTWQDGTKVKKRAYARSYLSITNLAVVDKRVRWASWDYDAEVPDKTDPATRGSVFWVSRIHSLDSVSSASVALYKYTDSRYRNEEPPVLAHSGLTAQSGLLEFPLVADIAGATIQSGTDSAIISTWSDTLQAAGWASTYQESSVYVYTDRPIYRPGQEVFLKGIYRIDYDGIFRIYADKSVEVSVRDSRGKEVLTQRVPVSEYGTFSTSVKLPTDAALGTYSIQAKNGYVAFDVEEYVGSAFEALATTQKEEYTAGEKVDVGVSGTYYFGVPLDGGQLTYSITAQNFYFDRYEDEYFSFGVPWYGCYDCGYGDTFISRGSMQLSPEGKASVSLALDFNSLFKSESDRISSKILVFHGTIQDKQGKSVSFQKSVIVHRGSYYMGVKAVPSFIGAGQAFTIKAKTVDVGGKPLSRRDITLTLNKVGWDYNKRQEVDGGYYARSERTLTPVQTKKISTDGRGDYSGQFTLAEAGEYQIDAAGRDESGNELRSSSGVYVYGKGVVDVRPTNNATLDLAAEKKDLKVGDTAKFVIQNPYPHARALISIERGRIFTYEVVDIDQSIYEYSFPITEDYVPNVFASVVLLSPDPEVKYGQLEFTVDKTKKALIIDVQSDKRSYLPGEKVHLSITTKDAGGKPVPAEVSVAVADVSVLALKGNPKKDPLVFFYRGMPLAVSADANVKNLLEETPIPTGTKGGGGGDAADLATKKRGEFKDTAFWSAAVVTDASGNASVSFTLPDNLTKWQVESLGVTKDTKLGVNYRELIAQKDVMAVPIAPRFAVPGDEFMIGAKLFNQTAVPQSLSISVESPTLELLDDGEVRRTVPAGGTDTMYFKVRAPERENEGVHVFTVSAHNDTFDDTVERSIAILPNETYEYTATAGSSKAPKFTEYLFLPQNVLTDRGGLTVKTSATLAVYIEEALRYLFTYPYGCTEQLASSLRSIAIAKRAWSVPNAAKKPLPMVEFDGVQYTADEAVSIGLAKVYENQTPEGGFSYYKGLKPNAHLTAYILLALAELRDAGYTVRSQTMSEASTYLSSQAKEIKSHKDTDTLTLIAYALSRAPESAWMSASLIREIESQAGTQYLSDTASTHTLGLLALIASKGLTTGAFKSKVYGTLLNRVEIDSRGAYVRMNPDNIGSQYYETPVADTALLLKSIVMDRREYEETPNLIRWLIASRAKDGSWGSTNSSVAALDALTDYLTWKRETESEFSLSTRIDTQALSATEFGKENILESPSTFLPVAEIDLGKLHAVTFEKQDKNELPNTFYYDLSLKYYLPVENIAPRDEGISISRELYALTDTKEAHPLTTAKVGEVVKGVITVISPKHHALFSVEDFIPAGFELVNFNLDTEDTSILDGKMEYPRGIGSTKGSAIEHASSYVAAAVRSLMAAASLGESVEEGALEDGPLVYTRLYPDFDELHDDRLFLFKQDLRPGTYRYEYYVRATVPGEYAHLPAIASDMYFPEEFGRTEGSRFTVGQ